MPHKSEQPLDITQPFAVKMTSEGNRSVALSYNPELNLFLLTTCNPSNLDVTQEIRQELFLTPSELGCIQPLYTKLYPYLLQVEQNRVTKEEQPLPKG